MMENGEEGTEGMTEVENKSLDVAEDVKTDEEELPDVVMNAKAPVNNEEKWMLQALSFGQPSFYQPSRWF